MLICVCSSINDLSHAQNRRCFSSENSSPSSIYMKLEMMLTLSRTAPASMPNRSAIGTILSGRLQVHLVEKINKNQMGIVKSFHSYRFMQQKL